MKVEGQNTAIKQVIYITSNANEVSLSRKTCEQLGLIPKTFPQMKLEPNYIENPILDDGGVTEPVETNTPTTDKTGLNNTPYQRDCNYMGRRSNYSITEEKFAMLSIQSKYTLEDKYCPVEKEASDKEVGQKKLQYVTHELNEVHHKPTPKLIKDRNHNKTENECLKRFKEHRLKTNHVLRKSNENPETESKYLVDHQDSSLKDKKGNNPIKRIEMELHAIYMDSWLEAPTVYWKRAPEAINGDHSRSKLKGTLQEEPQLDKMILKDENSRYMDRNTHKGCLPTWKTVETWIWGLGILGDRTKRRASWGKYHKIELPQLKLLPYTQEDRKCSSQDICSDHFQLEGIQYMATRDELEGWSNVRLSPEGRSKIKGLMMKYQDPLTTLSIPETSNTNCEQTFVSKEMGESYRGNKG